LGENEHKGIEFAFDMNGDEYEGWKVFMKEKGKSYTSLNLH
jgi:hypothetical protein